MLRQLDPVGQCACLRNTCSSTLPFTQGFEDLRRGCCGPGLWEALRPISLSSLVRAMVFTVFPLHAGPWRTLRLGLLRHWSLWEALRHSSYVAVRLLTWLEHGEQALQGLLVQCGTPLHQANLTYSTPFSRALTRIN